MENEENKLNYLESELCNLNKLLINCGFAEGIKTLKEAAEEMLEESAN